MEHVLFAISVETFLEQLRRFLFILFTVTCLVVTPMLFLLKAAGNLLSLCLIQEETHTQTPSCHIETQADKHSHTGKIKILPSQKTVEVQHRWTRWRKR